MARMDTVLQMYGERYRNKRVVLLVPEYPASRRNNRRLNIPLSIRTFIPPTLKLSFAVLPFLFLLCFVENGVDGFKCLKYITAHERSE